VTREVVGICAICQVVTLTTPNATKWVKMPTFTV